MYNILEVKEVKVEETLKRKLSSSPIFENYDTALVFDAKHGTSVKISSNFSCQNISDNSARCFHRINSDEDGSSTGVNDFKNDEEILVSSFTDRKMFDNSINASVKRYEDISHMNRDISSNNSSQWTFTPKTKTCKDIGSVETYITPMTNEITPGKLVQFDPAKKVKGDLTSFKRWENPVLGVDLKDSLPTFSVKRKHSKFEKVFGNISFTKGDLKDVHYIGHMENQFLACSLRDSKNSQILALFDQHAVDERIRLENLLKETHFYSSAVSLKHLKRHLCRLIPPASLKFSNQELDALIPYLKEFNEIGFRFSYQNRRHKEDLNGRVLVTSVPSIFCSAKQYQSETKGSNINPTILKDFIQEQTSFLLKNGKFNVSCPTFFKVLTSYACHGAIKFGDHLEKNVCVDLVSNLSKCQLPFQCAHGRPSIIPLLRLDMLGKLTFRKSENKYPPNLSKLKKNYV